MKKLLNLRVQKIILIFISVIILIYIITIGLSPISKINQIKELVASDSVFVNQYYNKYQVLENDSIIRDKAFKESLLKLSEQDSICLVINLLDSVVCLSIKGVTIHKTKINIQTIDNFLTHLPTMAYVKMFAQPLSIINQQSTIIKEPIVVRQAPKDTAEAKLNAYKPDTLIQNSAFLQMQLANNINITFTQLINADSNEKQDYLTFEYSLYFKNIFKSISNFISFKKQDYNTNIQIEMSADELRSIYRALPTNAFVSICF